MNIEIQPEDAELLISLKLKEQGLDPDITACILGLIRGDAYKLNTLFKQVIGLDQKAHYSEGDIVSIPMSWLETWRFNKEATVAKGLTQGGDDLMACKIVDVKEYDTYPYSVETRVVARKEDSLEETIVDMIFPVRSDVIKGLIE